MKTRRTKVKVKPKEKKRPLALAKVRSPRSPTPSPPSPPSLANDSGLDHLEAAESLRDTAENLYRDSIRLWFLIYDVSRLHHSTYDELMKPLAVSRTEWTVLAELSRHDGMTQTQLANNVDIAKATVGVSIDRLEESGWLVRRPDPGDRRARRVYLIHSAKPMIQKMSLMAGNFGEQTLGDLTREERLTLTQALLKIKNVIFRIRREVAPDAEDLDLT